MATLLVAGVPPAINRRALLAGTAAAVAGALGSWADPLHAATPWPQKPVRIVVQFGPGSASDLHARLVAEDLQGAFKQPFIVENKPGASGMLAAEFVARAPPDGHTLLLTTNTASSINPFIFKKVPYDPIKDFTPVARLSFMPFIVLVSVESPVKNVQDLVAYAKKNKIAYGYANATDQVAGATLAAQGGFEANAVPY